MKFTMPILVDSSLVAITIYLICPSVDKEIVKEILDFHYMTMPWHKNPCPGGYDIYSFGKPFLGHEYYALSLSKSCPRVEEGNFKEIMHFHYMTCMAMP